MPLPPFKAPPECRSRNMRAIRSFGNKSTERRLASLFKKHHLRGWRSHSLDVVGKPDFVIKQKRVAVFVDGCFFHGCPRCGHVPRTNRLYWAAKITRNKRRDAAISKALRKLGYQVVRVWECQLKRYPERCVARIVRALAPKRKQPMDAHLAPASEPTP
jgi:DNA mismatch endonuclease (patch repair protein)